MSIITVVSYEMLMEIKAQNLLKVRELTVLRNRLNMFDKWYRKKKKETYDVNFIKECN